MTPATSSTICIGSAYWRANICHLDAFFAWAKVLVPYCARRESASAEVRPAVGSTPRRLAASAGGSAYQATSGAAAAGAADPPAGAAAAVMTSSPSWTSCSPQRRPRSRLPPDPRRTPSGAWPSSSTFASASAALASFDTLGKRGSMSISVWARMAAAATRANGLSSAGTTYHGAHGVLVFDSTSLNAFW